MDGVPAPSSVRLLIVWLAAMRFVVALFGEVLVASKVNLGG